jgi:GTPase
MQFLDQVTIKVLSGSGGDGVVAWRREKFVPNGGPDGGDGGKGGSIYLEATRDLNTLLEFQYRSLFKAPDGEKGAHKNMHGKGAEDVVLFVPVGTIVRNAQDGPAIADLTEHGQRVLLASGGRGGRGNARFVSSLRKSPQFAEPGEPGIERELWLELKLIADVGIIGLPNAGKSTFISVVSAARPKIANYPFTTLVPNLGVVQHPGHSGYKGSPSVVLADIPGLIEGASDGVGLGHDFLRHVERTRLLLHLVSLAETDPLQNYILINEELARYSQRLAKKPQLIILSQADVLDDTSVEVLKQEIIQKTGQPVWVLSSATRQGVDAILTELFLQLETLPVDDPVVEVVPDTQADDHDDSAFEVFCVPNPTGSKTFEIVGGKVFRLIRATDMRNNEALGRTINIFKAMGVFKALRKAGIEEGDEIFINGIGFDYVPVEDA